MNTDQVIAEVVLAAVRRHSMDISTWKSTQVGQVHSGIAAKLAFDPGEIMLVSYYRNEENWYVITSRRLVFGDLGQVRSIPPKDIKHSLFGDFKGYRGQAGERMTLTTASGEEFQIEYETGKASMAAIYALDVLRKKSGRRDEGL